MTKRSLTITPMLPVAGFLLCAAVAAQSSAPPAADTASARIAAGELRVPIHTLDPDPAGGEYGCWAVGPGYKVSFHDGFVFYPRLGESYPENLPLRWITESVTAGGVPLADLSSRPVHWHGDWRYEYRWPGVTEAYEVRADGVEQLFVVHARPAAAGDLVVTGRVATRMRSADRPAGAHAALSFCDAGDQPLCRYGAATAVDARGRRLGIATGFDGSRVRIVVPAGWLGEATFPLTIDPLTSPVVVTSATGDHWDVTIAREEESATRNVLIGFQLYSSASDTDGYALLVDDDLSSPTAVFTDVSAQWKTGAPRGAFVDDADRWVLGFIRSYTQPLSTRALVYFHDKGSLSTNSGQLWSQDPIPNQADYKSVRVASPSAGTQALLVLATGSSYPSRNVWGVLADAQSRTLGASARINPTTVDAVACAINSKHGSKEASWVVAYDGQSRSDPNDDWDIYLTRIGASSLGSGVSFEIDDGVAGDDDREPAVDGSDGRYLLAMRRQSRSRTQDNVVAVRRIDWPEVAVFPTMGAQRVFEPPSAPVRYLGVAFDRTSRSHWCLYYRRGLVATDLTVRRLGYSGGETESAAYTTRVTGIGAVYRAATREFQIAYGVGPTVFGRLLQYPADAVSVRYGSGCQAPSIYSFGTDPPYAGSQFFTVRLSGVGTGTSCVLLLSLAPASIPLDFAGMTGCRLNVDPTSQRYLIGVPVVTTAGGASLTFPLPDVPLVRGDVFGQWLYARPGANPAGWLATWGVRMQVR